MLFLIPFRKYFVKEQHGKYPFPEATATTQVLVNGEGNRKGALTLLISGLVGGLYDFLVSTFGTWSETISTRMTAWGAALADSHKLVVKNNTGAAVLGLGYIIGLKYSLIICCGSFLVWFVLIPLINIFGGESVVDLMNSGSMASIASMSAEEIFSTYARPVGIGGIATAGIIGILKSFGVIKSAFGLAVSEMKRKDSKEANVERTQKDLPMTIIVYGIAITILLAYAFFVFGTACNWWQALIALLLAAVIAFLFTTVAANAIAIVGSNPVSGMTIMTLILTSLLLVAMGVNGNLGMVAAVLIGGVVCTALSVAGAAV